MAEKMASTRGCSPLAHGVNPERRMRQVDGGIDIARPGVQRVEIFGEGLPLPLDPLGQGSARNVLDPFHEADEPLVAIGLGGGESHPAIAHHERGDAVPRRRGELGVPGDLAVVVRVDIDPTRSDQEAIRFDDPLGTALDGAHFGDAAGIDRHIGGTSRHAGSIDQRPTPDDQFMHGTMVSRQRAARLTACWRALLQTLALPRIRFILVPQVGQVPCAARRPLANSTSWPSNSRFSRHFTQYPS